jgi:hypothetical protein
VRIGVLIRCYRLAVLASLLRLRCVFSGKTTAMSTLTERFQAQGWRVFRVPEAATMLLSGGHTFANLNKLQQYQFQVALLRLSVTPATHAAWRGGDSFAMRSCPPFRSFLTHSFSVCVSVFVRCRVAC